MPDIARLRRLLNDRNLAAVARVTGISYSALYRFAQGAEPRFDLVARLAAYLDGAFDHGADRG
jgi:DNA-binding phage protein